MSDRRYQVLTWDTEQERFTPQQGVERGPYTLWGLRQAIRKLREIGYDCHYSSADQRGDLAVSISRLGEE